LKKVLLNKIQNIAPDRVLINEPMSKHTTFGIGGPAACFIYPEREHLKQLLKIAHDHSIPIFFMGSGSNLLVSDKGFDGIVVSFAKSLKKLVFRKANCFSCESGVMLGHLVKEVSKRGIGGMEGLIGVPGTVGGALVMNAGAFGKEISNLFESATVLTMQGEEKVYNKNDINFSYRYSTFPTEEILIESEFKGKTGKAEDITQEKSEASAKRKSSQPLNFRSAGSIFKNPSDVMAAGYLIDKTNLKGTKSGEAEISEKHANFIINRGGAKASDVVKLIKKAKTKVKDQFNIELQLEIKLLGFDEKTMDALTGKTIV